MSDELFDTSIGGQTSTVLFLVLLVFTIATETTKNNDEKKKLKFQ